MELERICDMEGFVLELATSHQKTYERAYLAGIEEGKRQAYLEMKHEDLDEVEEPDDCLNSYEHEEHCGDS